MRISLLAVAIIGSLFAASCSNEHSGTSNSSVASRRGNATPGLSLATHPSQIASLPDRGVFAVYDHTQARHKGAYTVYPVQLSEQHALASIASGSMVIDAPDGHPIRLQYAGHVEHADGNWTWVGRPAGSGPGTEALITFGEKAVFASIPNGKGEPLQLTTIGGRTWMVETDPSKLPQADSASLARAAGDFLTPPAATASAQAALASIGVSAPTQPGMHAQAMRASAAPVASAAGSTTPSTTVDLLVGYTPAFATRLGGRSQAMTRLNFMVDVANQAYANSQVDGQVRLVNAIQVDYPDATSNRSALLALSGVQCTTVPSGQKHLPDADVNCTPAAVPAALQPLLQAREQYRADLVSLVRIYQVPENQSCGVAWLLGGGQSSLDANSAAYGLSVVSDTSGSLFPDDGNTCRDETLGHELGHNMGLAHDRDSAGGNDDTNGDSNPLDPQEYGRFPYSFGYNTAASAGNFYTMMSLRQGTQTGIRVFANPRISTCEGFPCGVANQEDNALTLAQTMPVVAAFRKAAGSPVWFRGDFDGDGNSDIVWRNDVSGANSIWRSGNSSTSQAVTSVAGQAWAVVGAADFDGDHKSDLLWRNFVTGTNAIWKSGNSATPMAMNGISGNAWTIVGAGDFNGDGKADVLWRNTTTGQNAIWLTANSATSQAVTAVTTQAWKIIGVGDFNGDGRSDILWRNTSDGHNAIWLSGNAATPQPISAVTLQAWTIAGVGDFDGDGRADILWRNLLSGANAIWKSGNSATSTTVTAVTNQAWAVAGVGDFDGDHKADILWHNQQTGANTIWKSGNSTTAQTVSTVSNLTWSIAG
jgi:peptidyl-Asp metalloendopeptidase